MLGLTLVVASIALADSINPSTVLPAIWLAGSSTQSRLGSFTLGVFAVYLAGGLVLVLGPGPKLISLFHELHGPVEHGIQAGGGILVLVFALVLWRTRNRGGDQPRARRCRTRASAFGLGAGIMAVELPTAFMYFGAISAILAAHRATPIEVLLLIGYNALFAAPLVLLLAATHLAGARTERWIASAGERVQRVGQLALTGVAGLAGAALLTFGLAGLLVL